MDDVIKDKALQDRFLEAVKGLSLRFEVADISKATGIGEPTVSIYLNSGRQVSRPFLRKFCEVFKLDYDYISTGRKKEEQGKKEYFTADQLFAMFLEVSGKQTAILQSIENKMAREDTLADVKTNSIELLAGVRSLSRRQKDAIKQMQRDLAELKSQKDHPSEGSGKSLDQNGGGEKKSGKRG